MVNYYSVIFNLFTSFGYFENERENQAVLENIYNALKPQGIFVLDFMNMKKALSCLSSDHKKKIDDVTFRVHKGIDKDGYLLKQIHVEDLPLRYDFKERIKIYTPATLKQHLSDCGFEILKIFGDYNLGDFNPVSSDRLIIISKKP